MRKDGDGSCVGESEGLVVWEGDLNDETLSVEYLEEGV